LNTDFLAKVATSNEIVLDDEDVRLPQAALFSLGELANQIEWTKKRIDKLERAIVFEAKRDEDMRRLAMIPGVVAIIAASIKALIPDPPTGLSPDVTLPARLALRKIVFEWRQGAPRQDIKPSRRYRVQSRTCAFHPMSRTTFGSASIRSTL
jgi:hypothetical protein